jgi:hypothetical protein
MAGHPRKPTGSHIGRRGQRDRPAQERALASWQDSKAAQPHSLRGNTRRAEIPIPDADEHWLPEAQSWFRSLKLSGQSEFYEASDWATAVAAAHAYDIFLRTYNASILAHFTRLSERLGVTIVDRKHARIELDEPQEPQDIDEEAADNVVHGWQERLNARHDDD